MKYKNQYPQLPVRQCLHQSHPEPKRQWEETE